MFKLIIFRNKNKIHNLMILKFILNRFFQQIINLFVMNIEFLSYVILNLIYLINLWQHFYSYLCLRAEKGIKCFFLKGNLLEWRTKIITTLASISPPNRYRRVSVPCINVKKNYIYGTFMVRVRYDKGYAYKSMRILYHN